MKIAEKGLNLIKFFEGLRLKAYRCVAGVLTIGYGSTRGVTAGQIITEQEAEERLKKDCVYFENGISKLVTSELNQNEFDALMSFTFNLGTGALQRSTLRMKLNRGDYEGAAEEILKFNKARVHGQLTTVQGLTNRRQAEYKLFKEPAFSFSGLFSLLRQRR